MSLILDATNKSLELITSNAVSIDWTSSWVDVTTSSYTPSGSEGNISIATTSAIVPAPGANTQRGVKSISIYNKGSSAQTITLVKDVGGTEYTQFKTTLSPQENLQFSDNDGFVIFDSFGRIKTSSPIEVTPSGSRSIYYYKVGTAAEAAAYWYNFSKDAGFPGAWAVGTPGLNGRNTSGTAVADAGCLPLWTSTASFYLNNVTLTTQVLGSFMLADILWVNTGLVVTSTTAQTITMANPLPARDINLTTSGEGCVPALLFTAATTNGATISNSTISYTNSKGTPGRTATLIATAGDMIPATPVIGTLVFFSLAAGDTGVQSIQNIALGTSLATGSVSLAIVKPILIAPSPIVNTGISKDIPNPGIIIPADSCLHLFVKASGASAYTVNASFGLTER
jgi:hypothetical protein